MSDDVIQQAAEVLVEKCGVAKWFAHRAAQALADAGLLPTELEWGVRLDGGYVDRCRTEEQAREWVSDEDAWLPDETRSLATRRTTPWKDAR